jgi:hypothetical protein
VEKADRQYLEPLRKQIQAFNRNKQCIFHKCKNKPDGCHVISESILGLLQDAEGKVLTWERSDEEIFVNFIRGYSWDHIYQKPKRISIGKDATYPIFCNTHDNGIFAPLEKPGNYSEKEQAALLAYRALSYKTWNPHLGDKLEFELTHQDPETAQKLRRVFSLSTILAARKKFEYMIRHKDYRELRWIKRILQMRPCIASVDATIPYDDEEDASNIASGKTILTPEDYITFTLYPDVRPNTSTCIVTYFKGNKRGEDFIADMNPDNSSDDDVYNTIIERALSMSLVYVSQQYWDYLNAEYKESLVKLQMRRIPLAAGSDTIPDVV